MGMFRVEPMGLSLALLLAAVACGGSGDDTTAATGGSGAAVTTGGGGAGATGGGGAVGHGGGAGSGGAAGSAGAGGACTDSMADGADALAEAGQFLPGLDAGQFCSAGSLTLQIVSIPADELAFLQLGGENARVSFALADSANWNFATVILVRQDDNDPDSPIVAKLGGGSCLDCMCCGCAADVDDTGCTNLVGRPQSPELVVGATYTVRWSAAEHTMCMRLESDPEACFDAPIPHVFAFNRHCAAPGCTMVHWGAERWSTGTTALTGFQCDVLDASAPANCP